MMKRFLKKLLPDHRFKKITEISPELFSGINLAIFDLDNTLVFSETTVTEDKVMDWFCLIKKKCPCVIVSNSPTARSRADEIAGKFNCDIFLSPWKKPSRKLFTELKNKYNFDEKGAMIIGDKIFTDILFGNFNGIKTVLINPLGSESPRFIERLILNMAEIINNV